MPSLFIFPCNVDRFIPKRVAAPLGPPMTQFASRSARMMCSRSASLSVTGAAAAGAELRVETVCIDAAGGCSAGIGCKSVSDT
jgi:hypothetical protein